MKIIIILTVFFFSYHNGNSGYDNIARCVLRASDRLTRRSPRRLGFSFAAFLRTESYARARAPPAEEYVYTVRRSAKKNAVQNYKFIILYDVLCCIRTAVVGTLAQRNKIDDVVVHFENGGGLSVHDRYAGHPASGVGGQPSGKYQIRFAGNDNAQTAKP